MPFYGKPERVYSPAGLLARFWPLASAPSLERPLELNRKIVVHGSAYSRRVIDEYFLYQKLDVQWPFVLSGTPKTYRDRRTFSFF